MLLHCRPVHWDETAVSRWLEPLASRAGELADVFGETHARGRPSNGATARCTRSGCGARRASGRAGASENEERFAFVSGAGEASVREAVRALRSATGREPLPIRSPREAAVDEEASVERRALDAPADGDSRPPRPAAPVPVARDRDRATRRLLRRARRLVAPPSRVARGPLHGGLAPRRRGEDDRLSRPGRGCHARRAAHASSPRRPRRATGRSKSAPARRTSFWPAGCAAVLFHEILGHALEADAVPSPLSALKDARVAVAELDVHDDARRLDLFGGYERDDEGTAPRPVKLLHSGHLGSRLTDRAHARPGGSTGHGRRAGPAEAPDAPLLQRRRSGRIGDLRGDRAAGQRRDLDRGVLERVRRALERHVPAAISRAPDACGEGGSPRSSGPESWRARS